MFAVGTKNRLLALSFAFAVFCGMTAAGYRFGARTIVKRIGNASLSIDPVDLNIGRVTVQDDFDWQISIRNNTSAPIDVTDLRTSCNCTKVEPRQFTIAPNAVQRIRLQIDLSAVMRSDTNLQSEWPFRVTMVAIAKGRLESVAWDFTGVAYSDFRCDPPFVSFQTIVIGDQNPAMHSVKVSTSRPLASLSASGGELVRVTVDRVDDTYWLRVVPAPVLPLGPIKARILLNGVLAHGQSLPQSALWAVGEVVDDVRSVPPAIVFMVRDGEPREETITLISRRNRAFRVIEAKADSNYVEVLRHSDSSSLSSSHEMVVRWNGTSDNGHANLRCRVAHADTDEEATQDILVKIIVVSGRAVVVPPVD